ncbi:hypothetical protein KFL_000450280 [Klebsormidium nitens]|uniref:Rab5-interacting protein n=1 Tax=Klebsormidium nitens TaxID=105231 RepID=A0A1Y1HQK3_KLENI|nr:hypothetical protein KFL_000450280 [Klebsormidium nitens]|eukprot:GAQ80072.1 hypothetical protein KFL_000450280 [Klebsormidium nitens]
MSLRPKAKNGDVVPPQKDETPQPSFQFKHLLEQDRLWDRDELGDVIHWLRQILGLIFGVAYGLAGVVGGPYLMLYLLASTGITYSYYKYVLNIDEDDFGGTTNLLVEGLVSGTALMVVAWVLLYSSLHV